MQDHADDEDAAQLHGSEAKPMPAYYGWPSPGPSQDPLLLRMRQAKLCGHVDWVKWTQETNHSEPKREALSAHLFPDMRDCPAYGIPAEDGSILWMHHPPQTIEGGEGMEAVDVVDASGMVDGAGDVQFYQEDYCYQTGSTVSGLS